MANNAAKYNPDTFSQEEYKHIKWFIDRRNKMEESKKKSPTGLGYFDPREMAAINWVLNLLEEISTND